MTKGGIAQLGKPEDVYDRPTSEFAFRFLGHTNVVTGEIISNDDHSAFVRVGATAFPIKIGNDDIGTEIKLPPLCLGWVRRVSALQRGGIEHTSSQFLCSAERGRFFVPA
jgi:ABC-type proline/glycine betaine transport system ATPase subunit